METSLPVRARGVDLSLPTCGETRCNGRGSCVSPAGAGPRLECDCRLGYRGEFCQDTVNGDLSLPLTISVVAVIVGLLILAFIVAKLRQKQKQHRRKHLDAQVSC